VNSGSKTKLVVGLVLVALLVVLIAQNSTTVEVKLFFWTITGPLVILAVVVGALGLGAGLLLARVTSKRAGKTDASSK
jgi:uncharacterized integral membrane protein